MPTDSEKPKPVDHDRKRLEFETLGRLVVTIEHDISNPLSAIQIEVDHMLRQQSGNADVSRALERIAVQMRRVFGVLSLLRIFRTDQDTFDAHSSPVHVDKLVGQSIRAIKAEKNTDNIYFYTETGTENLYLGATIPSLLEEALVQILRNSVKAIRRHAGRDGGVVRLTTMLSTKYKDYVEIQIHDNGAGIPGEQITELNSLLTTTSDEFPSRGMGLFIAKTIISQHRGRLSISSRPGEGTTVSVYCPLKDRRRELK